MSMATVTGTWVTPLTAALTQAGVSSADADVLSQAHPTADVREFLAGFDWVAELYISLIPPPKAPTGEPWASIAQQLSQAAAGDIDQVLADCLKNEPPVLQSAIVNAVLSRAQMLQTQANRQTAKRRKVKSAEYLQALADLGYTFRMNTLNDLVEIAVNGAWQPISDPLAKKLRRQMRDKGYEYVNVMEDAYVAEAYDNCYHPVHAYLDSLQYDGGSHIATLASYFKDKDDVFPVFLKRWLIGAIAKARTGAQNRVLVLDGCQNLGKSFFVSWLGNVLPDCLIEAPIAPDEKDCQIRLASKWVWEVSEFGSTTRKADREALKSFLTLRTVTVRKPYGLFDMVKPALANFIGTFNNETGVLNDPTGNRRFMIANLTAINWDYARDLDPNAAWAEANAHYLSGETWNLTAAEVQLANKVNERYEVVDPLENLVKKFFHLDATNTHTWTATDEILIQVESNGLRGGSTRQNAMALAALMTKLGHERAKRPNRNGQRVNGYVGVDLI